MAEQAEPLLREAKAADLSALQALHRAAFGSDAEARLVAGLTANCDALVSLVAELDKQIVGHVLYSPATVEPGTKTSVFGLAPMAVLPSLQRRGTGSRLVRESLDRCRDRGVQAVVVLGHTHYYPRFGFRPAADFGLQCVYDVPSEAFMALELEPGALQNVNGIVHYHPQFDEL